MDLTRKRKCWSQATVPTRRLLEFARSPYRRFVRRNEAVVSGRTAHTGLREANLTSSAIPMPRSRAGTIQNELILTLWKCTLASSWCVLVSPLFGTVKSQIVATRVAVWKANRALRTSGKI